MKRLSLFVVCGLLISVPFDVAAATLTVGTATIEKTLAEEVFNKDGRWYLQQGACYAYLDSPRTWLAQGRVHIEANVSAQLGAEMSGTCVGTGFASKIEMSGRLAGAGTKLMLADIRVDRVENDTSGAASDLLQSIASMLPPVDVLQTIRERLEDANELPISVDSLRIDSVVTSDDAVTIQFDVALRTP